MSTFYRGPNDDDDDPGSINDSWDDFVNDPDSGYD